MYKIENVSIIIIEKLKLEKNEGWFENNYYEKKNLIQVVESSYQDHFGINNYEWQMMKNLVYIADD